MSKRKLYLPDVWEEFGGWIRKIKPISYNKTNFVNMAEVHGVINTEAEKAFNKYESEIEKLRKAKAESIDKLLSWIEANDEEPSDPDHYYINIENLKVNASRIKR